MSPDVVVEIGNSRWKSALVAGEALSKPLAGMVGRDSEVADWDNLLAQQPEPIRTQKGIVWAVAGSNQPLAEQFERWAVARGDRCWRLTSWRQTGLTVRTDPPEQTGHDRLLNAAAVKAMSLNTMAKLPAVIVAAGTAITVDLVDQDGSFLGGTIAPGLGTMAKSLHTETAKLPLIPLPLPELPSCQVGCSTGEAITVGVTWTAIAGTASIVRRYQLRHGAGDIVVTGGDGRLMAEGLAELSPDWAVTLVEDLSLQGLFIVAREQL